MKFILLLFMFTAHSALAQELFVFTEPAINMAAKSFGFRANNYLMFESRSKKMNYHLLPEVMWGASRKLMLHAQAFLSNRNNRFVAEGGQVCLKYRFYSVDQVHSHFRLALYGRYSFNNSDVHQRAIDLNGNNAGYEAGFVATKLKNKLAVSASISYLHATDNGNEKFVYADKNRNATNYTFSVGKLMLPKEYTSYNQPI